MPDIQNIEDFFCRLILVRLTQNWIDKLRDEITYPGLDYLPKWFPSEFTSFIGILIALRCMSMVKRNLLKYVASIMLYTALDWITSHESGKKALMPCCLVQFFMVILYTYPLNRLKTEYRSVLLTSVIFGGLKALEISHYKLFFTDHVFLIYLTVIMLPERLYPKFTSGEIQCLKSIDHMSISLTRLNIFTAYPVFGAYWFINQAPKLFHLDLNENFWLQIFDQGFRSPFQVFTMVCFVSVLTDHVTDWIAVALFPSSKPWPTSFPLMLSCQLFAFLLDEGIWNLDRDEQWKLIRLILLIPVFQVLLLVEHWLREFLDEARFCHFAWKGTTIFALLVRLCIYSGSGFIFLGLWPTCRNDTRALFVLLLSAEVVINNLLYTMKWVFATNLWFNHSKLFYATLFGYIFDTFQLMTAAIRTFLLACIMCSQLGGIFRFREIVTGVFLISHKVKTLKSEVINFWANYTLMRGLNRIEGLRGEMCPICQSKIAIACETECKHRFHVMCFEDFLINTCSDKRPFCPICRKILRDL